MIPKIIHYCWFGNDQLPESALKCIESWKKFLPGYEIKEWNESNFDVNMIPYTSEAYRLKKYAFVSDFCRFYVLYKYGGLYFDTDVELIKPIDDIIARGAFMGFEKHVEGAMKAETEIKVRMFDGRPSPHHLGVNPGLGIGAPKGHPFYKDVLNVYMNRHFVNWNGKFYLTVVGITSQLFNKKNVEMNIDGIANCQGNLMIYPEDYFCPINCYTGEISITDNTRSIHHYHATWTGGKSNLRSKIRRRLEFIGTRIFCTLFIRKRRQSIINDYD